MLWPGMFNDRDETHDLNHREDSGMQKRQPGRAKRRVGVPTKSLKRRRSEAVRVFGKVYKLLEEYGPRWYSLTLRQELRAALKSFHQ
jgi:hypothetical protein